MGWFYGVAYPWKVAVSGHIEAFSNGDAMYGIGKVNPLAVELFAGNMEIFLDIDVAQIVRNITWWNLVYNT